MADRLILAPVIMAAAALLFSAGSAAQALSDPTRPPLELMGTVAGRLRARPVGVARG